MPQIGIHKDLGFSPDVMNMKKYLAALIGKQTTAFMVVQLLV
jgi:hypothetical protein